MIIHLFRRLAFVLRFLFGTPHAEGSRALKKMPLFPQTPGQERMFLKRLDELIGDGTISDVKITEKPTYKIMSGVIEGDAVESLLHGVDLPSKLLFLVIRRHGEVSRWGLVDIDRYGVVYAGPVEGAGKRRDDAQVSALQLSLMAACT